MTLRTDRNGFALPMVIMVIGFMTAGVLAGFARTDSETRIVDNQRSQTLAFAVAESGLEAFMANNDITLDTATITATFTPAGGTATVTAMVIRPAATAADTAIWLIRSTGEITSASGRPLGTRTVAQLAYRMGGTMHVVSSWSSLSGLHKNGAAGDINGADACNPADTLAAVAVPDNMITGKDESISGNPDVLEMGTKEEMAAEIKIDWVGIVNGSAPSIQPNHILCKPTTYGYESTWSGCPGSWPTASQWAIYKNRDFWPVIVINGSSALPSDGWGTLIVTGDLTFGGGDKWDGIILVGGKITDNGSGNIAGAVVSGLNIKRPDPWPSTVGESSKANGTKDYTFDSCKVESAASGQGRLVQIQNAWVDNWTAW